MTFDEWANQPREYYWIADEKYLMQKAWDAAMIEGRKLGRAEGLEEAAGVMDAKSQHCMELAGDAPRKSGNWYGHRKEALMYESAAAAIRSLATEPAERTEEVSDDQPEKVWICKFMVDCKAVRGTGEARRLIEQGGVFVNGEKVTDHNAMLVPHLVITMFVGRNKVELTERTEEK